MFLTKHHRTIYGINYEKKSEYGKAGHLDEICNCCGSRLISKNFNNYSDNIGISVSIEDTSFIDYPTETDEFWIEEIPLDDNYKMLVKHRKVSPDYVPEDNSDDEY